MMLYDVDCHKCGRIATGVTEAAAEALADKHDDKDQHEVWWSAQREET